MGSLYALMALGLTMSYSVTKVANFAHAELVTIGAYVSALVLNTWRVPLAVALGSAFGIVGLSALAIDELVYKPLTRRGARPIHLLVASIGAGLVARYVLSIYADINGILTLQGRFVIQPLWSVGLATLTNLHVLVLPSVAIAVLLLHLMFTRSKMGKAMRALADNPDLARVTGVPVRRIRRLMWVIAGGLTGVAGGFWGVFSPINPETGWILLIRIFAASILGGLVSFYGTIAGAYIVGTAENLGIQVLNEFFGVDVAYRPLIAFVIIVTAFLIRPVGLVGLHWPRRTVSGTERAIRAESE